MITHDEASTYAHSIFPVGCRCSETDSGGDCDWCQAYYSEFDPTDYASDEKLMWADLRRKERREG
jgi:hypothetical protein